MSAHEDVARMLTLVPWLLERPGASHGEIAEAFDVDVATVRRDLAHLDFCGLPGLGGGDLFEVATVGDRVVLRMADELRRPLRPTPREALRLVLTVDAATQALGDEVPALASAVDKVRRALGIPERTADVADDEGPAPLAQVRRALTEGRRLRLAYQGRNDPAPADREVDPWRLDLFEGVWYLQGHDVAAGGRRVFRLDRVAAVAVLDTPVAVGVPDDLAPPDYVPGDDDLAVELDVAPGGRWLLDAVRVDEVLERDDGGVHLRLRTDAPGWLARLVLMAAGDAVVRSPASLAGEVHRLAVDALRSQTPEAGPA